MPHESRGLAIGLTVALVLAAVLLAKPAFFFGGYMLQGMSYGQNGLAAVGVAVMLAPPVIGLAGVLTAMLALHRGEARRASRCAGTALGLLALATLVLLAFLL